ncbi:autotransporter outer membrane beta-barrel domain-containing protein [Trabulsiella odontotermitis]|uniref:autotransporter outer membrane beta-barrel domain-containing protein n=1 Tax=Trabulsiella odontotermitis TaxID=379893 RepID=UPI000675C354|nr:autotransporter outer membrane beta-barrel domain-containing protein [Trabulsiella odontotermitis]KNC89769.1 hypothetical protein GM30_05125 [Trabulsiella odontotermitis]
MSTQLKTLVFLMAFSLPQSSYAATFCGNRTNIMYDGSATFTGTLDGNSCLEIGAWNYGSEGGYARIATGVNMQSGSLVSVLGFMENSVVNSGAEVYVTRVAKIADSGFDSTVPAIASNITVYSGGLVRVYDGGTLKNSILDGGTAYISNSGTTGVTGSAISNVVSNNGQLYIYNGGTGSNTVINNDGLEHVQQSGTSSGTQINGGIQYVSTSGISNDAQVNQDGLQYVYDGGTANNSTINNGGVQYLFISGSDSSAVAGVANNTVLNGTGVQIVQQGGKASLVTLNDNATQTVYADSSTDNVILNDSAVQVLYDQAVALNVTLNNNSKSWLASGATIEGVTQINDNGQLQLSSSADGGSTGRDIVLNGPGATLLALAGSSDSDFATVGTLEGDGNVKFSTVSDSGSVSYSRLNVDTLSGGLHFYFNTSLEDGRGNYLHIVHGSGNHYVTAMDSGAEITAPGQRSLDIITDASGDSRFSLSSLTGTNINAVDAGTYMYSLYNRDDSEGKIWYLAAEKENETPPAVPPSKPNDETPAVPEPNPPGPSVNQPRTTPGTDAVLSMAVAPLLMFKNEFENLRFRQGISEKTGRDSGVWVRFTGGESEIDSRHTDFRLEQSGLELGIDHIVTSGNSKTRFGLFSGYDRGNVKHARGGVSTIDSLSIGVQATWFHHDGWYVDGVLKYNSFDNSLSAISTNGSGISGDYDQDAWGTMVELGKSIRFANDAWAEPYMKFSAIRVEAQDVKLNNGMKGNIDAQNSVASELGVNVGRTFMMNKNATISPYFKAAWEHEYIDNNSTLINNRNAFTSDLSGDMGKIGLGVNTSFNKELTVFAEIDYAKGNRQENPAQANLGVRYSF